MKTILIFNKKRLLFFHFIISVICFKSCIFLEPDYSTYSLINQNIQSKIMKIKLENDKTMTYIYDQGGAINNTLIQYTGNELNTEYLYDKENTFLFITCLTNDQIGKINSSERKFEKPYSLYNYNKYKCSISKQVISNINYIIITQTYSEVDSNNIDIYRNFITKIDYDLNLISQFNFTILNNENVTYNQIFQCISIESNKEIFCAYAEINIYGFFINNDFNDRENLKKLFPDSEENLFFKLYQFTDDSIIIIVLNHELSSMRIKLLTSSSKSITIRELYNFKENTLNYLDLVSVNYISDSSFVVLIGKSSLTYFWCEFSSDNSTNNYIVIKGDIFSNIKNAYVFYSDSKIITYLSILEEESYQIYKTSFIFPSEQIICSSKNLYLISNDTGSFDINELITSSVLEKNLLKLGNENGNLTIDHDNYKINYSVGENGNIYSKIYYNYITESEIEVRYSSLSCIINVFICNGVCSSCNEYSSNKSDTKCISCKNNYYLSNTKRGFCSICSENYQSIWDYNTSLKYNDCLYDYNYCYDYSDLNKPFMIYDTFECVENCPTNYNYFFGNYCVDNCNKDKMISSGVTCYCNNNYKFYLNKTVPEILCVENCPVDYPYLIDKINECTQICPSQYEIIFNYTCLEQCPSHTTKIKNDNKYTCECQYYTYEININNLIYIGCTNDKKCPKGMYINNNSCVTECENYHSDIECLNSCNENYIQINELCINLDSFVENIEDYILLLYNQENVYLDENEYIIQIYNTSTESINLANSIENVSKIDLGSCKNIIQDEYSLYNEELIIFKIDIFKSNYVSSQVEYLVFTLSGKKIDLNICSNVKILITNYFNFSQINYDLMISLAKNGYDIFDPEDYFYSSVCSIYKNEYGTDVINTIRRKEYYQNISICEEGCEYKGLDFDNYSFQCLCSVNTEINLNDKQRNYNIWYSSFKSPLSPSNLEVFKCYKYLFKNFLHNFGQMFEIFCILLELVLSYFIIFHGLKFLFKFIHKIIEKKNTTIIKKYKISNKIDERKSSQSNNVIIISNDDTINKNSIIPKSNPPKLNKNFSKNSNNSYNQKYKTPLSKSTFHKKNEKKLFLTHSISKVKIQNNNNHPLKNSFTNDNNIVIFSKSKKKKKNNKNNTLSSSQNTFRNLEEDCESNEKIEKIFKNKNNSRKNKEQKLVFFRPQVNFFMTKDEKMINIIKPINESPIKTRSNEFKSEKNEQNNSEFFDNKKLSKNSNSIISKKKYANEEIIFMKYQMALKYDNIPFFQYYWLLLKFNQLIIFTFITDTDYNLRLVKIALFIFSLDLFLFFSAIFFSDNAFTDLYKNKGNYNFFLNIPKAIFSSIICGLIKYCLSKLSMSHDLIKTIKSKKGLFKSNYVSEIESNLKIKFTIFYIILYIFMIFFWYYISVFCSIYRNTQLALFKSSSLSFLISMFYPFLFCLLNTIARKISLRKKWGLLFKLSSFLNYL